MQFHHFEPIKQRIIEDCHIRMSPDRKPAVVGLDAETEAQIAQSLLSVVQRSKSEELLLKSITSKKPRPRVLPGTYKHKIEGDFDREMLGEISEYEWFQLDRPFYNVYPIVEKLVHNTKLNVSAAFLRFPFRTMLFRFAHGHEPYGIKTVLITLGHPHAIPADANYFNPAGEDIYRGVAASAFVEYVDKLSDGTRHEVYTLAALFEEVTPEIRRPYEPLFPMSVTDQSAFYAAAKEYQVLQTPDGSTISEDMVFQWRFGNAGRQGDLPVTSEPVQCQLKSIADTIADQHDAVLFANNMRSHPSYMGFQSLTVHQFVFKLAALVSMLHRGDNLIAPIVLAKHQERYEKETDAAAKKWLEDKAAQIQGRGFSVGKELQQRSDISPHWRNPHMALYWTGPGRKEPTMIFRAGADVMLKKLGRVPTGFLGTEQQDEGAVEPKEEYVYFLREPGTAYVKIGRTRRTVAERKRQLEGGFHGLTLVGHIVTGDCVELETRLHREYAAQRRRRPDGRRSEFFELTDAQVEEIVARHGGKFHLKPETV